MADTNDDSTAINRRSALQAAADALARRQAMLASINKSASTITSPTVSSSSPSSSSSLATTPTTAARKNTKDQLWQREEAWKNPLLLYQDESSFSSSLASSRFDKSLLPVSINPSFIYYFDDRIVDTVEAYKRNHSSSSVLPSNERLLTYTNPIQTSMLPTVPLYYPLIFTEGHDQIGYRVWDGGIMLSKYLEYQFYTSLLSVTSSPSSLSLTVTKEEWEASPLPLALFERIIEIGAGTGIVSMVLTCLQNILHSSVRGISTNTNTSTSSSTYIIGTDIVPVIRKMIEQGTLNGFSIPVVDLPEIKNEIIKLQDDDDEENSTTTTAPSSVSSTSDPLASLQQYYVRENISTVYSCVPLPWGDHEWMTKLQTYIDTKDIMIRSLPSLIVASDLAAHPSTVTACMETITTLLPTTMTISTKDTKTSSTVIPELILCCQMHREFTEPFLHSLKNSYETYQVPEHQLHPLYSKSSKHTIWRIRPKIL